jgi:hypothetical protein
MLGRGTITGRFALPSDPKPLATLRSIFRPLAIRYGLDDLDTAALRDGRPRALTQAISRWIYTLTLASTAAVAGIEFDSRHGDQLRMWALATPPLVPTSKSSNTPPSDTDSELNQALTLLGVEWAFD